MNFDTLKGDAYIINVGGNKARVLVSVRFVMETVIGVRRWNLYFQAQTFNVARNHPD